MPAAKSKLPDPDAPLRKLAPTGGWIDREPTAYAVRASNAEQALSLAVFCDYVHQGEIPQKYAGRVAHTHAELAELPGMRTFGVLVGKKRGPSNAKWTATEIIEITKES
jgi:hypothetical protein